MEQGLGSFNNIKLKLALLGTHLIFVAKAKRDGGKTFLYIFYCFVKKSPKKVLAKDLYTTIF